MGKLRLKTVKYRENAGQPKSWSIEGLNLGNISLLVGRNATGKTRCLNIIINLAALLRPDRRVGLFSELLDLTFECDGKRINYVLHAEDGNVVEERYGVEGEVPWLKRGRQGGQIFMEHENKAFPFRPPLDEVSAMARRDSLQHPFLEPLHQWASGVRHYPFGSTLGKHTATMFVEGGPAVDDRVSTAVIGIFREGERKFGDRFVNAVKQDMKQLDYDIENISINPVNASHTLPEGKIPPNFTMLGVEESGVREIVDQIQMSQGMFRALSLLVQVNYSQLAERANCILIDDIGEGLDFRRSTALIKVLRAKANDASFQLVMTTNDQFVMDVVPLQEWSVLQREGGRVSVRDYGNSRQVFDEFRFVGLNNFAFFEMDFKGFESVTPPEEQAPDAQMALVP